MKLNIVLESERAGTPYSLWYRETSSTVLGKYIDRFCKIRRIHRNSVTDSSEILDIDRTRLNMRIMDVFHFERQLPVEIGILVIGTTRKQADAARDDDSQPDKLCM